MQETRHPTLSIQSRLKRVKLVHMTPERVPAPENESSVTLPLPVQQKPAWHTFLGTPLVKGALGLLIGIGLLVAVSRFVDFSTTIHLMQQRLTTPQGVLLALLASLALVLAFSIRAMRWKVLLNPVGKVRSLTVLQLFLIGVFLNFLLLPSPPGQVGSNEVVALLIFTGLLHLAPEQVIAMAVFFHPWSGLLMCVMGMACLSALVVRFSQTLHLQTANYSSTHCKPPYRPQ